MENFKEQVAETYKTIQDEICQGLERLDGRSRFEEELWSREGGGGGRTRIIQNGDLIEKGGVNFSAVHGKLPDAIKESLKVEEDQFFATGVSIVLHPKNPFVPIIHLNIRYFELNNQVRWFGGGIDLTPHYVNRDEAKYFHTQLKTVCDKYSPKFYPDFKTWADHYFYNQHRQETRGIGGIFYDRLNPDKTGLSWEQLFDFSCEVGRIFVPTYVQLAQSNRHKSYSDIEKSWQCVRRGRYVEFNLVYDAGTKFGLETNGRVESILMSLPPMASWLYNYQAKPESEEENTLKLLKKDINWIG